MDGVPGAVSGWSGAGYVGGVPLNGSSGNLWEVLQELSTHQTPSSAEAGRGQVGGWVLRPVQVPTERRERGQLAKSWYSLFWPIFMNCHNDSVASFIQGSQTSLKVESTV